MKLHAQKDSRNTKKVLTWIDKADLLDDVRHKQTLAEFPVHNCTKLAAGVPALFKFNSPARKTNKRSPSPNNSFM